MVALTLGAVVLNFNTVARVVAYHAETRDPVLKQLGTNGRLRGGKWLADAAKCRVLSDSEVAAYFTGSMPAAGVL
jgi:hypothetical protein